MRKMIYSIQVRLLQFFGLLPLEFSVQNVLFSKKMLDWSRFVSLFVVFIIIKRTHILILQNSDTYSGSILYVKLGELL